MDVVLSAFITGGSDPFCTAKTKLGKEARPADLSDADNFAYIQPFVATVAEHRLHGILLHDGLSQAFVEKHSTDLLSFVRVDSVPEQPNHERRFAAYREWLADKSGRVWLVDVNDIAFTEHPFRWWDSLPLRDDVILCGEEHNPYQGNPWFEDTLDVLPNQYGNLLLEQHGTLLALNCGAWGARCDIARSILDDMIAQFAPTRSHAARQNARFSVTLDMYAFAWTLLTKYAGRVATFRMNGNHPLSNPGVTLRHFRSPLVHDRPSALAYLTKMR